MPKAQKKKQQKIIEDRTFGLKNKNKSKTVQKFIKGVQNTVKNQGKSATLLEAEQFEKKKMKKKQAQEEALLKALYKDIGRLKEESSEEEEDPKNTVCPYFKQGLCQKGKKCIYSHDLTLDRNEEIDLYVDQRTQLIMNQIGTKNLNDLSEEELSKLLNDKQKQYVKGAKSSIVCKFFMQAVEKDKYGWNWTCQNGDGCKYKHCLPPGYILQRDAGKIKIEQQEIDIEQKIDEQRNKLNNDKKGQLVTYETFMKWKEERAQRKLKQVQKKRKQEQKKNKNKALLRNGRQLFTLDPTLFIDDAEAADNYDDRQQQFEQEENEKNEKQEGGQTDQEAMEKIQEEAGPDQQ